MFSGFEYKSIELLQKDIESYEKNDKPKDGPQEKTVKHNTPTLGPKPYNPIKTNIAPAPVSIISGAISKPR